MLKRRFLTLDFFPGSELPELSELASLNVGVSGHIGVACLSVLFLGLCAGPGRPARHAAMPRHRGVHADDPRGRLQAQNVISQIRSLQIWGSPKPAALAASFSWEGFQ